MTNQQKGGFDVEFAHDYLDDNVTCSVCLHILRLPLQAIECGHRFCKSCVADIPKRYIPLSDIYSCFLTFLESFLLFVRNINLLLSISAIFMIDLQCPTPFTLYILLFSFSANGLFSNGKYICPQDRSEMDVRKSFLNVPFFLTNAFL